MNLAETTYKTILAFDTSTEIMALTLYRQGKHISITRDLGLHHSEKLLPLIDALLELAECDKNELDLVACAAGPGSFMGLRVGFATAKALAAGLHIPYISIPSPDIYSAAHSCHPEPVITVIDAKRKQFYGAIYLNGQLQGEYLDASPEIFVEQAYKAQASDQFKKAVPSPLLVTGPDAELFIERCKTIESLSEIEFQAATDSRLIQTYYLAQMAMKKAESGVFDKKDSQPMYLRRSDAEIALEERLNKK